MTRQSASLNGHSAQPLTGCDHSTICKFEGRFGPFAIVADKLRHLKRLVVGRIGEAVQDPSVGADSKTFIPSPFIPMSRNPHNFADQWASPTETLEASIEHFELLSTS